MATRKRRKGPGRPPFPKGEARDYVVTIRVTGAQRGRWERAAAPQPVSEWARELLDNAAGRAG